MHKILLILASLILLGTVAGCSDDDKDALTVSFRRAHYILPSSQPLKVELRLSQPAAENMKVAFLVGGTAEEGNDYSLSAHEFEVVAGAVSAEVEVTPLNNMRANKEIRLELVAPEGYGLGLYRQTMIPVETRTAFTSYFFLTDFSLHNEMEFGAQLYVGSSLYQNPSYDIRIPFDIDPASTAVLGTHFEIVGGEKNFLYRKDDFLGRARLKFLKKEPGKDKIVLRLVDNENFMVGLQRDRAYIKINGPAGFADLKGTWRFKDFTSKACIDELTQAIGYLDDLPGLPVNTSSDILVFETRDGRDVVNTSGLTGDLKNYLRDGAEVKVEGIVSDQIYGASNSEEWGILREMVKTRFSEVNLSFSPGQTNIAPAEVDFRLLEDGNELEMRIVEYIPTDFLQRTYAYYSAPGYIGDVNFNKALPMKGKYTISFRFTRVD